MIKEITILTMCISIFSGCDVASMFNDEGVDDTVLKILNEDTSATKLKNAWKKLSLPEGFKPLSIYINSGTDVWVAGYSIINNSSYPRIYSFKNGQWHQSNILGQDSTGHLTGIHFRNDNEGWASFPNKLYKYDNTDWSISYNLKEYKSPSLTGTNIREAVSSQSNIWFYGEENDMPIIYRWNGSVLSNIVLKNQLGYFQDFHFDNNGNGYAIAEYLSGGITDGAHAYFYNGFNWLSIGTILTGGISISGNSNNDVWASDGVYLFHYDGSNWSRVNDSKGSGVKYSIQKLRLVNKNIGWGFSSNGSVYYFDGNNWQITDDNIGSKVDEIYSFPNGDVWIRAGDNLFNYQ